MLCRYEPIDAEALAADHRGEFDIVIASEVIEHVLQPADFVDTLCKLCSPSGVVVITSLNRTPHSYALAILAAEYVLGIVPKGTHDWNMFVTPQELTLMFQRAGRDMSLLSGMNYWPLTKTWQLSSDTSVNYAAAFVPAQEKADSDSSP
jgi:2-polyprenyl-6-hydroxyphenyl methylase / 3-demethylubiquinone-9 3-methyltransferase